MPRRSTRVIWIIRIVRVLAITLLIEAVSIGTVVVWPKRVAHPALQLAKGTLAIQHARVYTSPTDPVLPDVTILIQDGRIAAVGPSLAVPSNATLIPCHSCIVTAGFWNAHIHFTQSKWTNANWKSAAVLNAQLSDMLSSRGFTTVVDAGSNLIDTLALRRRVESGELSGPLIYTAGAALYPPHGIPYYLRDAIPGWIQYFFLPQPNTPKEAENDVQHNLDAGADITKLFTGSYIARDNVLPMPLDIARAAVEQTHRNGRLVFTHPSDLAGTRVAMDSGVDVLAHAPSEPDGIDQALFTRAIHQNMAMIPTLKMYSTTVSTNPRFLDPIYAEVRQFHALGGQLIFGTDVGYMRDYTTDDEFAALAKSGLTFADVLAMLTTNPAARFGVSASKGTITPGKLADLTVLSADPAQDLLNFAQVQTTIRSGRVIFQR